MPQLTLRNGAILDTATLQPDSPEGVYFLLDGSLRVFSDGALFDPAAPAAPAAPSLLGSARTLDANLFEGHGADAARCPRRRRDAGARRDRLSVDVGRGLRRIRSRCAPRARG